MGSNKRAHWSGVSWRSRQGKYRRIFFSICSLSIYNRNLSFSTRLRRPYLFANCSCQIMCMMFSKRNRSFIFLKFIYSYTRTDKTILQSNIDITWSEMGNKETKLNAIYIEFNIGQRSIGQSMSEQEWNSGEILFLKGIVMIMFRQTLNNNNNNNNNKQQTTTTTLFTH